MSSCGCSGYFITHQLEYEAKEREKQRSQKRAVKRL